MTELRAADVASDTDYAGRSLKGQLTQARRSGATVTAVVRGDRVTLRVEGEEDQELALEELPARLASR